jgi:hypothetical protein
MARHIVVAFRIPPAGLSAQLGRDVGAPGSSVDASGGEAPYLVRARSLCARGEALGGRLVAWCAALLAMAWDTDSVEEAILLGASIREDSLSPARRWASGMAEGELEPLAADGARMQLAWGEALVLAESLARIALPGELLVDGDVQALRAGQLALLGPRAATDSGRRVHGWSVDLAQPWRNAAEPWAVNGAEATDRDLTPSANGGDASWDSPETTQEMVPIEISVEELSSAEVLEMVEASADDADPPHPSRAGGSLADLVRRLVDGEHTAETGELIVELRRLRAHAEDTPPSARCQAALALALALASAGRPEEALLDTLDALARAREAQDPKALRACTALLVKLYMAAGRTEEAAALRDSE